jgi:DNA-binding response OmpR family regulator
MTYRILLVDADPRTSAAMDRALTDAGYRVASVTSFEEAREQIGLHCPDLLITAIRLGAFNGLHLALRYRTQHPGMPVIVTGERNDAGLASEVTRYGGHFILAPAHLEQLVALVRELLADRAPRDPVSMRRWPRKRAKLPATVADAQARIVDLSYGGMRIEFTAAVDPVDTPVAVDFPTLGFSITAVPKWSKQTESGGTWFCGAEVDPNTLEATRAWRWMVDSVN